MIVTRTITLRVVLDYNPDVDTAYSTQERFLATLAAKHLHYAEIIEGIVDPDDVPVNYPERNTP